MKTAVFLKQMLKGWRGDARLYSVAPDLDGFGFVIVSGSTIPWTQKQETFIFGCDNEGNPATMEELHGSFQGKIDHAEALRNAGYEVVEVEELKV